MKPKLTSLLALTFLFLFSGSVFANDYQDAKDAYERKDYKTSYKLWLPLAEQGVADAQYTLGQMYLNGQGVSQDYKEALKWYRLSAEQGYGLAQSHLGFMYYNGQGVPLDFALAHKWFNLASLNGDKDAVKSRNLTEERMTPAQIEKAQEMARNWKPTKK